MTKSPPKNVKKSKTVEKKQKKHGGSRGIKCPNLHHEKHFLFNVS